MEPPARCLQPPDDETERPSGTTTVEVAGATFHADAIRAAQSGTLPDSLLDAVLVPETDNTADPHAVAVYVNREHVGYLPEVALYVNREQGDYLLKVIAAPIQQALLEFNAGRAFPCWAKIDTREIAPQVVLYLDPAPPAMVPGEYKIIPGLAASIWRLLPRLDEPAPPLTGLDRQARIALGEAESARAETEANYNRAPGDWPRVERAFMEAATRLEEAQDPQVAAAWLGVARCTRYQKDRRCRTVTAFVESLHWDRTDPDAWCDLIDYAAAAPHIPTLLELFARIPVTTRPKPVRQLLSASRGQDRLGKVSPDQGACLRKEMLSLAVGQGDTATVEALDSAGPAAGRVQRRRDRGRLAARRRP
ncbi:MAG: hypothetical protein ACLQDY_04960 [Streptosporangiaceae bacterium]